MCLEEQTRETFSSALSGGKCSVGATIKDVVKDAMSQKRLTVGLLPAIQHLSTSSDGALFCLLAPSRPGDSANHMHEVLLEAFCFENDIFIVKVDSAEKMQKIVPNYSVRDCTCILVHQPYMDPFLDVSLESLLEHLSPHDKLLVNHCEATWGMQPPPIIRLPEQ